MKKNCLIVLMALTSFQDCLSQKNDIQCLQGNWEIIDVYLNEGEFRFTKYKLNRKLSVLFENNEYLFSISYFGFVDTDTLANILSLDSIKESGNYYCTYKLDEKNNRAINVNVLDHFYASINCDEISFGNAKIYDGNKIVNLPYSKLCKLPITVLREFFDFKTVKCNRLFINSTPAHPTKMYLLKGDLVEIIEEKPGWLKIKYYPEKDGKWTGETIEGWIKKEDVE